MSTRNLLGGDQHHTSSMNKSSFNLNKPILPQPQRTDTEENEETYENS